MFDRFHVMKNYSDVIKNQLRIEFRKAHAAGKDLLKGSHYLLLKNRDKPGVEFSIEPAQKVADIAS